MVLTLFNCTPPLNDNLPLVSPVVTGTSPTNNQTPTWTWNTVKGAVLYRYELDGETENWTETAATAFTAESELSAGDHTLYVQAKNAAQTWTESGSHTITIDLIPPEAPTGLCLAAEDNSGNPGDTVTNKSSGLTIGGEGEPAATVSLFRADNIFLGSAAVNESGLWSIGISLAEGTHVLSAKQTDAAGNGPSAASTGLELTIDCTCNIPVISGISNGMFNTNQTFSISGESNSVIQYSLNNGQTWNTYSGPVVLSAFGGYSVIAKQTDVAGNNSAATSMPVFVTISGTTNISVDIIASPNPVNAGAQLMYTITVTNDGATAVENVIVQNTIPSGISFISSSGDYYGPVGGVGIWTAGPLSPETTAMITVTCSTSSGIAGGTVFNADATTLGNSNDPANPYYTDSVDITVERSTDLACGITAPGTVAAGGTITYAVTVTNNGPSDATNVQCLVDLDAKVTYSSHSTGKGTYNPVTNTWQIGSLAAGETVTLTLTTQLAGGANPGDSLNTYESVTGIEIDVNFGNNFASAVTTVTP